MPKGKPNTFIHSIHDAHNHDIRKMYCIAVGLTGILCKISLQFCCEFIDNNRSNICTILDIAKFIKLPTSTLLILHSGLKLAGYKSQDDKGEPKKPAQVIGSLAFLANCTIGILMQTKIIHFLAGNNKDIISYISLTSAVLFLFSEFISYYYTWKKYLDNKNPEKSAECRKDVIFSTITLSLGLLSFTLKRMEIATIPIDLGGGIIYNFNLSITVSLILSIAYLISNIDKFVNQPSNGTDPSTGLYHAHHTQPGNDGNDLPDGNAVGM
ncbi:Putative membrane protein [Wolbachia endosymbiont of Drosophila simulans wNo]|uniref:hypothetical protein n=1 Tax=unclassified Wolbachia TaxID=2640676 RepID=UPI0002D24B64|nr:MULTISPECIES: hypothetical protein [unclassified Wolbachia]AGJ98840.1 Putative membrane protein [Wolbachia endosymbiont of Drosophila simulans wNo]QCB62183.1 hypothetical protein EJA99_00520 [Wolbachia endosymbiont of Drosophila mauritiana]QCB63229.1 hypothetical protein EJB00_00520 [Wolbachia endosymbiont of Drosophila mauritiana]QWE33657.1 hypothetical protein WwMa_07720 [Wolbachia endosymbiont of Drosophila simulans]TGB06819.1 hypothetical protein E5C28_02800 [Wolbachia endosymbiont of D